MDQLREIFEIKSLIATGIEKLDDGHSRLFEIASMCKADDFKGVILQRMSDLEYYTYAHTKDEEELFEKYEYGDRDAHEEAHRLILQSLLRIRANYDSGKTSDPEEAINAFLENLYIHINDYDKRAGDFLTTRGAR